MSGTPIAVDFPSVPGVLIAINGIPLTDPIIEDLISVSVTSRINEIGSFSINLQSWSPELRLVTWADFPLFAIGNQITIAMGWLDAGELVPLFMGEITGQSLSFGVGQPPTLTVTGSDYLRRLSQAYGRQPCTEIPDALIATEIIVSNGLIPIVPPTALGPPARPDRVQDLKSDLRFLGQLAEVNRFFFSVFGPFVYFGPRLPVPIPLTADSGLTSFSASVDCTRAVTSVRVVGRDKELGLPVAGLATALGIPGVLPWELPALSRQVHVNGDSSIGSAADAMQRAQAELYQETSQVLGGSGECHGNPLLLAGLTVLIGEVGLRFAGPYQLDSVTHTWATATGYTTQFTAKGSPPWLPI